PRSIAARRLASTYLSFLHDAQMEDGRFHNFMSYDRKWLDEVGTQDSFGRAFWSLGYGMAHAVRPSWQRLCARLLLQALPAISHLEHPRSKAYTMIGLCLGLQSFDNAFAHSEKAAQDDSSGIAHGASPLHDRGVCHAEQGLAEAKPVVEAHLRTMADDLKAAYLATRDIDWQWFEDEMTYDNARLCEAMLRAGLALRDDELIAIGLRTFSFYERVVVEHGVFVPVGNDGWYRRGGRKAQFGQQPLEAAAFVDAALVAYECTSDPAFQASAQLALDWFYGRNSGDLVLVRNGGSCDGLEDGHANANMGAESTLAFLASAFALAERPAKSLQIAR
ncbi:MAG: hypothetical protein M3Y21_07015, partial [Candidatus Eremiobacteraeota bacterium]|nr:hypothetical protein [Candidatus Eremiobacteraeota bacterium]